MLRAGLSLLFAVLLLFACSGKGDKNTAPVVSAGSDVSVFIGDTVTLTGVATDPDGDALTLSWSILSSPAGSTATLGQTDQLALAFAPDVEGPFVLQLAAMDAELESTSTVTVTAEKPPFISGDVRVTVVDYDDGSPIVGATVKVGTLSGVSNVNGEVFLEDPSLDGAQTVTVIGPGTVRVDHDLDPTTGDIDRPAYRGATLHGAIRSEFTVPLRRSGSFVVTESRGMIRGQIAFELFDRLPAVETFISVDSTEVTSGQLRSIIVGAMPDKPMSEFSIRDLLGRPLRPSMSLPGNLTTDDLFLNGAGAMLGAPTSLGDDPFINFEVDAPAGSTRFFVIGTLIDVDTDTIVPLLTGGTVDPAVLFGAMSLTVLFVGFVDYSVPAGGVLDIPSPIRSADLVSLQDTDVSVAFEDLTGPWAFGPATTVDIRRAVLTLNAPATVTAPTRLDDVRLAANLPAQVQVEITNPDGSSQDPKQYQFLDVPGETGPPSIDVAYNLIVAVATTDFGQVPFGLVFTRVADSDRGDANFPMPPMTGDLAGAATQALSLSARGLRVSGIDLGYDFSPGLFAARTQLTAGSTSTTQSPVAFPTLTSPGDSGLQVRITIERSDTSTTTVDSARAFLSRLDDPTPSSLFGSVLEFGLPQNGELIHATLGTRILTVVDHGGGVLRNAEVHDPLWDLYANTADGGTLALPDPADLPFTTDDEILVEIRVEGFPSPLDMERWSAERLRDGPAWFSSDSFVALWP